jgi:hypothetical protein
MKNFTFEIVPPYEVFYIHGMLFNTQSAVPSIDHVSKVLHTLSESKRSIQPSETEAILNHLQNIIVQGAVLSRYLWPVRKGHAKRGQMLRNFLKVTDENPLKTRDLRNDIEHFDEKLDLYLANGLVGYIFPQHVGLLPENDGVPCHVFRAYYVDVGIFELLGKRYEIQPIADEIWRLHSLLIQCDINGGRLSSPAA